MAGEIPRVALGRTGLKVSRLAIGTGDLWRVPGGARVLRTALRMGVNYVDTASQYGWGRAERLVGSVRGECIVATKVLQREAEGAYREFMASLRRLRRRWVHILQLHAINDMETLDRVMARDGALRALERLKREGRIRHIGITGHQRPEVLRRALERYPFETVLLPVSGADYWYRDFEPVIQLARKRGVGVLAMKVLLAGRMPADLREEAIRYALGRADVVVIGCTHVDHVRFAVNAVQRGPLEEEARRSFLQRCRRLAKTEILWWKRD